MHKIYQLFSSNKTFIFIQCVTYVFFFFQIVLVMFVCELLENIILLKMIYMLKVKSYFDKF